MRVKLLGSNTSPYVRKVRILAREKGLELTFEVTDPNAAESPVPAHNPLGKVPVLIRPRASALFDSPVITSYLDSLAEPRWYPEVWADRFEVLRLEALADGILDATVTRLLETRRPEAQRSDLALGKEEARIGRALDFTGTELAAGSFGDPEAPTMADIALAVSLEYLDFRYPHAWRSSRPKLAEWFHRFRERPSFVETLPPGFSRLAAEPPIR